MAIVLENRALCNSFDYMQNISAVVCETNCFFSNVISYDI